MQTDIEFDLLSHFSKLSVRPSVMRGNAAILANMSHSDEVVTLLRHQIFPFQKLCLHQIYIFTQSAVRITARREQLAERRRNLEENLLIGGVLVTPER